MDLLIIYIFIVALCILKCKQSKWLITMIKVISLHFNEIKIIVKNVVNNWKCFQYNESKNKYGGSHLQSSTLGSWSKRQLWVQGQPGLCSHLLLQKSPSLPKINLVWNGLHDTILIMSNTKTKPQNLHVGTWTCEMARWVKGLPEFSLGNPHAGKRRMTPVSWPPHTAHVPLASPQ